MNNKSKRMILFLLGCMGARFGLTYLVKNHDKKYKSALLAVLLIPAIGFSYIYMNGLRKTGAEVFGDKIWWNDIRPFHSLMYFLTAYLVYIDNKKAYYPLALDTIVGLRAFIKYHI
tara:strand:+ start:474 stop:821 length:348 start_codon:yes stop_codon:yes gene_type:complete